MNTENNLLLARFIGGKTSGETDFFIGEDEIWLPKFGICLKENKYGKSLDFDTDWTWLMYVVEKIESLKFRFEIALNEINLYCTDPLNTQRFSTTINCVNWEGIKNKKLSKIEATYKACVEFVKWFNQQNNEK